MQTYPSIRSTNQPFASRATSWLISRLWFSDRVVWARGTVRRGGGCSEWRLGKRFLGRKDGIRGEVMFDGVIRTRVGIQSEQDF